MGRGAFLQVNALLPSCQLIFDQESNRQAMQDERLISVYNDTLLRLGIAQVNLVKSLKFT